MHHQIRFTTYKIAQRLALVESLVYRRRLELAPFRFLRLNTEDEAPPLQPDLDDSAWPMVEPGTYWAGSQVSFVLRSRFQVPDSWQANDGPIALHMPLGDPGTFSHPEALVYIDGVSYAGTDRHHHEVVIDDDFYDGQTHTLMLHGWTGNGPHRGEEIPYLHMRVCSLVQIDQATREFVALARVMLGVADALDEHDTARSHLLNALDEGFKLLDIREPQGDNFYASIPPAHTALYSGLLEAGAPADVIINASGHAHIDVAWLWTLAQTRHKARRTFHTALHLMNQFPEYLFTQSQPQLYDYVRQDDPALFEAIQVRVADGRWEPIGGMWVEADCNISGGESLARQFLLGRQFFTEHFGPDAESPVLWLPDVFGYAWNLPQLIKQAGLEYFFTIKIGWNAYNRLPYDSFWWQGLDGTSVLTHFSTTPERPTQLRGTYNAKATPWSIHETWKQFQQKDASHRVLMAYGYGDGGGGPTREMLENINLMQNFPATPRVKSGPVIDFFRALEAESGAKLPTWNGELYLEIHRGTYTTQAKNKLANRRSEFWLHDAEYLATVAALLDENYNYPMAQLRRAWELVCLNQFHDIIPGSSINAVYVDSMVQYEEVEQLAAAARDDALQVISQNASGDIVVINPTGFPCRDVVAVNRPFSADESLHYVDDSTVLIQPMDNETTLISPGMVPPYGMVMLTVKPGVHTRPATGLSAKTTGLRNSYVRVEIDKNGDITRIYDVQNDREILPEGAIANQFLAFEDRPLLYDAWDVDIFYDDKVYYAEPAESITVVEYGPLRATVEIKRRILNSRYTQRISLNYNSPIIEMSTTIDWRERHILLKSAFPVDVLSPKATYEIQFGNVERPTHRNTSWDWARFEVAAQKWIDLSEGDYGVSLVNDSKYGFDVQDNVMRISLLRGSTSPDPVADQGEHTFKYSLLPHQGPWDERTIAAAYALNDPLIVLEREGQQDSPEPQNLLLSESLFKCSHPNVVIETVKRSEDGQAIIVRMYESHRQRGTVSLRTSFPLRGAWVSDIMETQGAALTVDAVPNHPGSEVKFNILPYQVITLRLSPE